MKRYKYTPKKIDKALGSLSEVIDLHKQQSKNYHDMHVSLSRIRFAMIRDFDDTIKLRLESEKEKINAKIDSLDPESYRYEQVKKNKAHITMKAKVRLMKGFSNNIGLGIFERWDEFIFHLRRQWESDRAMFIKSGEIEP